MDAQLVAAAERDLQAQDSGVSREVAQLLEKANDEDLVKYLDNRCVDPMGNAAQYLRAIWLGANLSRKELSFFPFSFS